MFGIDSEVHVALDALYSGGPTRYLLLSQTPLTFDPAGYTGATEPSAPSYVRVAIAPGDWSAAADRFVEATVDLPDPVEDWGVLPYWGLASASSAGVVTWGAQFDDELVMLAGSTNGSATVRIEAPSSLIDF